MITTETLTSEEVLKNEVANEVIPQEDNRPTEEDIKAFEAEYELAADAYRTLPPYTIAEGDKATELIKMSLLYNNEMYNWSKDEWRGVLFYNEMASTQLSELEDGKIDAFTLDKDHLQWLYFILTNPSGTGIESARKFADNIETFMALGESVSQNIEKFKDVVENLRYLQDRVAAAYQGFHYVKDEIIPVGGEDVRIFGEDDVVTIEDEVCIEE